MRSVVLCIESIKASRKRESLVVLLDGERSCVGGIDRTNSDGPRLQSLKTSDVYLAPSMMMHLGSGSHCNVSYAIPRTPDLQYFFSNVTIQLSRIDCRFPKVWGSDCKVE